MRHNAVGLGEPRARMTRPILLGEHDESPTVEYVPGHRGRSRFCSASGSWQWPGGLCASKGGRGILIRRFEESSVASGAPGARGCRGQPQPLIHRRTVDNTRWIIKVRLSEPEECCGFLGPYDLGL